MNGATWASWAQAVGSLLAVFAAIGAAFFSYRSANRQIEDVRARDREQRVEHIRSCWAAVRCEIESCSETAEAFLKENIGAPAYRLPQVVYRQVFPELLSTAQLHPDEAHALYEFFVNVDAMNRGIDFAHAARGTAEEAFQKEAIRTMSKADGLRPGGRFFNAAMNVLDRHHPEAKRERVKPIAIPVRKAD